MARHSKFEFKTEAISRAKVLTGFRDPVIEIQLVSGPSPKKKERLALPRICIGSSKAAQFQIPEDPTVSALHCELVLDGRELLVRDLGSRNGVLLRDRRVQEAWLLDGDELVLGRTVLKVISTESFEEQPLHQAVSFHGLRGSSGAMRQLYARLAKAATSDAPVLLQGPTGSGKELAAEALIAESPRANRPVVVVDCSALPPSLAERELFGHEAGAFTGGHTGAPGAFERANTGTLFLDELGELPLELQPKLLGALERKQVQRLGGTSPTPIDVRIIAATHRPLERMVNEGTFRADLYYRLSAVSLALPPLAAHREDIPELVQHFLKEDAKGVTLSSGQLEHLRAADYPGNVRELRNAVLRAVLDLPVTESPAQTPVLEWDLDAPYRPQKERLLADGERRYLVRLLEACGGNMSEAARRSGLNRVHLYQLFERHRLALPTRFGNVP